MSAGTITLTNNSDLVVGTGTTFTSDLAAGDIIVAVVGGVTYTLPVKSIESDISATLIKVYDGPTQAGSAWTAVPRDTLSAITAQLGAEAARALRGLNYDKQNWQSVYSDDGDITVTLPDGSTFTGPSWKTLAEGNPPIIQSIGKLQTAADQTLYFTAKDTAATTTLSEFGRTMIASADQNTARTALGLSDAAIKVNGAVPIEQGGTGATTAEVARGNLGLVIGSETGNVVTAGSTQVVFNAQSASGDFTVNGDAGFSSAVSSPNAIYNPFLRQIVTSSGGGWVLRMTLGYYVAGDGSPEGSGLTIVSSDGGVYTRRWTLYNNGGLLGPKGYLWGPTNTAVDANGFIKQASPVVKLFGDGSNEPNSDAEGVTSERLSEGVYRLSGAIMGLCSDTAWHIEVPADENKQPLIWVDYEIEPTGDVIVKTYHRTHPTAPAFARNERDGYDDGEPIDIPAGRWVDLRVQVYSTEMAS